MKKYFLTAAALLLLSPLTASAAYIGSGTMTVAYTPPASGGYYADYDVTSYARTAGATIQFANLLGPDPGYEAFCIEKEDLITPTEYSFYTSDGVGAHDVLTAWTANYVEVTWIANWATTTTSYGTYTTDEIKAIGQVAIWNLLGVMTISTGYGAETAGVKTLYSAAGDKQDDYVNDWLLAVSPAYVSGTKDGQNYLVKAAPVPEPGTMLLFGTGLAGLAAVSRRRRS